ncbi:MAG TPA: ABC transporter substrate-binding protein [Mycobacteriales bacterium]|nr:ABC transporter substrate-binding protein [Mycobacteriales bacterium]
MKRSILRRCQLPFIAAVSSVLVLAACGSSSSGGNKPSGGSSSGNTSTTAGEYGSLPNQTGTPKPGGTITYGIEAGSQPTYIMPITPGANSSVYNAEFQYLLWRPLYWTPQGNRPIIDPTLSLASLPVYSNGNKTITINMKQNYKWSDGKPVDAQDVLFFLKELAAAVHENAANFGNYTKGNLPDNIASMSAPSQFQVVLHLTKAYNPNWYTETQLNVISPLPSTVWNVASAGGKHLNFNNPANAKKIYDYLNAQSKKVSTYASNPLWQDVDGPFKLTQFNPTTDANTMVPNATYGGQKPVFSTLKAEYFASSTAEFNAMLAGKLNEGEVPSDSLPQVPKLKAEGYNVYGYPDLGFDYIVFNFKDQTDHWANLVGQLYFRQAMAHLENQVAVIHGAYHGAAAQAYGPVPAVPATAYVPSNAATNPYPYSTSAASQLLSSHGWHVVPNGTTTCQNPGSGPNQCGAGIPKGQKISITIPYTNDPPVAGQETTQLASAAKQVGININPVAKTFNYIIDNYDDPSAPQNDNKWQMENFGGFSMDIYPTTDEIFNTKGSFNEGGYSSPQADQLIKNSEYSSDPNAVQKEAQYLTSNLPAIFTPNEDRIYAWKGVSGPPDSFADLTQFAFTPEFWFVTGK